LKEHGTKEVCGVSARLVRVTLARLWEPGAAADENERIELSIALDRSGQPDVRAWLDDPSPWPLRWIRHGTVEQPGDVAHDEDGWQLRFFEDAQDTDVPVHRIHNIEGGLRPGEVLTLSAPDGSESAWRVVGVSAP
jgi:hypothetical protein